MLARIRKSIEEKDEGFTLIELLVVIIIIGILAAIAIPVFLNQRKKGYDAQAKSSIRDAATAEETYLTDNNFYSAGPTGTTTDLVTAGWHASPETTLSVVLVRPATATATTAVGADSYCLKAVSKSGTSFWFDSATGVTTTTACAA